MSIEHIVTAAQMPLPQGQKLVLMAIADDASRDTRRAYPGHQKMMLWSDTGERRVAQILEELIARQLVARVSLGYEGRRSEYLIFPTSDEIDALDAKNPALNRVSDSALQRVHDDDERRRIAAEKEAEKAAKKEAERVERAARKATPAPVDNSNQRVQPVSPSDSREGETQSREGETHCTPTVLTSPSLEQSYTERHPSGAVENPTDSASRPNPKSIAARHELDPIAVTTAHSRMLAATGISEAGVEQLCREILGRSASPVVDPTAYVIKTLRNDSIEWQARAFAIAAGVDVALAEGQAF